MINKSILIIVVCLFSLGGCAQKNPLEHQSFVSQDAEKIQKQKLIKLPGSQEFVSFQEEGIHVLNNGMIYIKVDGRSILSILDDVAFTKRFNYTVLAELPDTRIKIYDANSDDLDWETSKGRMFSSLRDLLTFLEKFMNNDAVCSGCNYRIADIDDGIV
ncbi:MAG: hypothetical protein GQ547_01475, partial [Methylophaga sp.]|nr:hypothetical protein [Methylophaga sp.]